MLYSKQYTSTVPDLAVDARRGVGARVLGNCVQANVGYVEVEGLGAVVAAQPHHSPVEGDVCFVFGGEYFVARTDLIVIVRCSMPYQIELLFLVRAQRTTRLRDRSSVYPPQPPITFVSYSYSYY